ncbi:hypothetical protein N7452_007559 [Penicillium brevicompactum]|uniref:Uncharacterized protein n=1 Tax=Penicillium brevicompactum TaxID=5074 RepID=A0A9W9UE38_PENBR|nr:hypothetical protein N7452_007559 [Penicillium brevicompactum]
MKASNARLYPRHHSTNGFLPIAPRPGPGSASASASASVSRSNSVNEKEKASKKVKSRSGSKQDAVDVVPSRSASSASSVGKTPVYHDAVGAGDWSGSEGSFSGYESSGRTVSFSAPRGQSDSTQTLQVAQSSALPHSAPGSLCDYPTFTGAESTAVNGLFDSAYSLLPSTSAVLESQSAQTMPMVSPLEEVNPFEFSLDPALALGYSDLEDMNLDLGLPTVEGAFHVEDWSRYMWSAETGFEHLDTGFPLAQ